jgi:predicted membrane-bound mannosyltransferase
MTGSDEPPQSRDAARPAARTFPVADIAVGLAALLARGSHLAALHGSPIFPLLIGDSRIYDDWGRRIAAGHWLGEGVFYQAPLYPYFLGVLYSLFGHSLLAVRLVQAILGSIACVLVARAGRRFFDPATGLVAGVTLALYPSAIFFDGQIQKSSLDLFLVATFLLLLAGTDGGQVLRIGS